MPVSGPDRCPECGHSPLVPLDVGCCPECGFEFDRHTLIWRPNRPWRIYILFANAAIFSPWLFRFLAVTLLYHQWPGRSVIIGALLSAGSLCWALPRLRVLLSEGHRYAAITPRGVRARTPRATCTIPWDQLAEFKVLAGVPRLRQRDRREACYLEWIFDTDAEVSEFIDHLARAKDRYLNPQLDARAALPRNQADSRR